MAKVDHSTSFYKKMAELQEKLKRSEEERLRLEEKFAVMMKSCREEEEKRLRTLRERYEKFLEDDKRRRDRNERILHTLEKIESRAAALTAKSERLKLLRKHYEAYLIRMYPLWKKQSRPATQQAVPTHYPLSLPMDTEKVLPWYGNVSGLYMNNMALPSARSSLSPGSDQLWVPQAVSRNIPMYDNIKQSVVHKPVEMKGSVIETCSPAVEGALDNYLQRAAELLRVPVEELEGHSEKRDEEKSVHTEQDTSRDLLNVSLSDDSILLEKKADKIAGNAAISNAKGKVDKMEGDVHIPEVDYRAGGDNILSEMQSARFNEQVTLEQQDIPKYRDNNVSEKKVNDTNQIRQALAGECKPEIPENDAPETALEEVHEQRNAVADQDNFQYVPDRSIEREQQDAPNVLEEGVFVNDAPQEYAVNDLNEFDTMQQPSIDAQPQFLDVDQASQNMNYLSYGLEQEAANEQPEYIENMGQNETEYSQEPMNSGVPGEYVENQESQFAIATESGHVEATENIYGSEVEYSGNEQNYGAQNAGVMEQYDQGQYVDNVNQQYEQYPDNREQYEQQQQQQPYVGDAEQLYDQQYPEQHSNDQYQENTAEFEGSQPMDNTQYMGDQNVVDESRYESQYKDPNQQPGDQRNENVDENVTGENINQSLMFSQNVDQDYKPQTEGGGSQEYIENPQLATNAGGNADDVEVLSVIGDQVPTEANKENQETTSKKEQEQLEESQSSPSDQVLENQEGAASDTIQQRTKEPAVEQFEDHQAVGENVSEQAPVPVADTNIPSAVEDDSEESSAGFWNPPHHSTIPSVDELAPKTPVVNEDTSESSADSKMNLPDTKPPVPNTVQQFRSLLGVPPDPSGDSSALSDQDDVEDQLAALVKDPAPSIPAVKEVKVKEAKEVKQDLKAKEVKGTTRKEEKEAKVTEPSKKVKGGKTVTASTKSKLQRDSKSNKPTEAAKPTARTGLKKPPSLIKVLESDTESLNLESGAASNVDSDEFDFSTE